ncbi:agmatine deiminase family protein [Marinicellulosiphila megalodicopiae]|uniref:agmatine deiminase family protein n=1 Tax=Marinicellulosiphila megalodicopiae TaxID=2724896 RepID=UPI003BB05FC4
MLRFAAQWQNQDAILIAWPHLNTDWQPWFEQVNQTYIELVSKISPITKMIVLIDDCLDQISIEQSLLSEQVNLQNIRFININYDDTWARDFGVITLTDTQNKVIPQSLNFTFNAWGDKFGSSQDNQINSKLEAIQFFNQPLKNIDFILEGGSIETDGKGTLLTSEICLLNPNRNKHLSKQQIEQQLIEHLNVKRVLWLQSGHLAGDDTDAHIDTLARFVNENTIVFQGCTDKNDEHFDALTEMKFELESFKTLDGCAYNLIELPLAQAQFDADGERLPASYVNFLISHQHIFVPIYQCDNDKIVIELLTKKLPQYTIVPVNCRTLIEQFGSLHCITMQLPQHTLNPEF